MPTFTLDVPVNRIDGVVGGSKIRYGYQEQVSDGEGGLIPNPETEIQFTKRMLLKHLQGLYIEYAETQALSTRDAAVVTATTEADDLGVS